MATFEINGKEYELKLTYQSIKLLNKSIEGGSYGIVGNAIAGDLEAFPNIVHAGLIHTGENFSLKTVESEIEKLIDSEKLSLDDVAKICDEVVTQSFFFAKTVKKMVDANPEIEKALKLLRG